MMEKKNRFLRLVLLLSGALLLGCLLLTAVSAIYNTQLPTASQNPAQLSQEEIAHVQELLHLHKTLGNDVWPGWGEADTPIVVYNEAYTFLFNYSGDPPVGWAEGPAQPVQGNTWEVVDGGIVAQRPYYRQKLADGESPQAFALLIGEDWGAALTTKAWMKISLTENIKQELPPFLQPIFPYMLFVNQLINSSEHYVALFAHETFHAFQAEQKPDQFAAAENATRWQEQYPWFDDTFIAAWQTELDLLTNALEATSVDEQKESTRQFLQQRQTRRNMANLSPELIAYEQQREWLEGTAKYVELTSWQAASQTKGFESLLMSDSDFDQYNNFEQQWQQELAQMGRMADDEGDGRFYYTGWAQATLLDQLMPNWKTRYLTEPISLESLLVEASAGD